MGGLVVAWDTTRLPHNKIHEGSHYAKTGHMERSKPSSATTCIIDITLYYIRGMASPRNTWATYYRC